MEELRQWSPYPSALSLSTLPENTQQATHSKEKLGSKIGRCTMSGVAMIVWEEEKNENSCLVKERHMNQQREPGFDAGMLNELKRLAFDPCDSSRDSIQPLWNYILRLRKLMTICHTECPRRKRKLHHFVKGEIAASDALASKMSLSTSSVKKPRKSSRAQVSHTSSISYLINDTKVDSSQLFDHKTLLNSSSSNSLVTFEVNNNLQCTHISPGSVYLDLSALVDSDESVNGSNPLTPVKSTHYESPESSDLIHSSKSTKKKPKESYLQPRRQSIRLQKFVDDHHQRLIVPIGPRFQAYVPEYLYIKCTESEDSKWLGTRIWPIEGRKTRTVTRIIGKGRPNSFLCGSMPSTDCVKCHILEESRSLMMDLGPAFFSWKFDEMGEAVLKSWSLKDEKSFEMLDNNKNLLKNALRIFPRKSRGSIVSYYLNVYVPRRIRTQISLNAKEVDSDNDDESTNTGAKKVKSRYLRQCR